MVVAMMDNDNRAQVLVRDLQDRFSRFMTGKDFPMDRITFKVRPNWKEEENIAKRLSRIVTGGDIDGVPFKKDTNGNWVLDVGKDWFFSFDQSTREATLQYRYGFGRPGLMEGLKPFLELVFG
jgi:hypothetical protein